MTGILARTARRIKPATAAADVVRPDGTLTRFVLHTSGVHQIYVGIIAIAVALLNFVPIDLQRRVVDEAITDKDIRALLTLGGLYLVTVLLHSGVKYALMIYQGWVGESAIKAARDQLARVASQRETEGAVGSGQTVNVIGNEIDSVGGFVGTSISEFIVNVTMMITVAGYMIYMQPVIALTSAISLVPQILLAFYMQTNLNVLVGRQVGLVRELGGEAIASAPDRRRRLRLAHHTILEIFHNRLELYLLKFGLKALLNISTAAGSLTVLIVGGYLVIRGQTTLGTVVAFVTGFQRLSEPTGDLLDFYRVYWLTRVQFQMILNWVVGAPALPAPSTLDEQQDIGGE